MPRILRGSVIRRAISGLIIRRSLHIRRNRHGLLARTRRRLLPSCLLLKWPQQLPAVPQFGHIIQLIFLIAPTFPFDQVLYFTPVPPAIQQLLDLVDWVIIVEDVAIIRINGVGVQVAWRILPCG